jgi:prohibitin 2
MTNVSKVAVIVGSAVVFILLSLFMSYNPIPSGHVGVQVQFQKVLDEPLLPGPNFIMPWINRVELVSEQPQTYEVETETKSKDTQKVKSIVSIQHYLDPLLASKGYAKIGDLERFDKVVISPAIYECVKAVTAEYTAEELITKRDEVKNKIDDAIQAFVDQTLKEKDVLGSLRIINVSIKDFDFSPGFDATIEAKVQAQQVALQAEANKRKRITDAEAGLVEKQKLADAEAYQIEKASLSRADAIKREAEAIANNPSILQLRAIERWDGTVPKFTGGSQIVPFINVDDLGKE